MKSLRKLIGSIKKADTLFNLINDGDKIVIGISGGKDSIALFTALIRYKAYTKKDFTLFPVMLNLGFSAFDAENYIAYFKTLGYDLIVEQCHDVSEILAIQKERQNLKKLPCSICSKMKKAAINEAAIRLGANKVAFAHHVDDALETLLMNLISGGRFSTFQPKMLLDRTGITFIRPLILCNEKVISSVVREQKLPIMASGCPNDKKTRREDIKNLLKSIYKTYDTAETNFSRALLNDEQLYLWHFSFETHLAPDYTLRKVTTPAMFNDVSYLRYEVFINEQHISLADEYDSHEEMWTSYVVYHDEKPVATLRLKYVKETRTLTFGRIAVLKEHRNKGIAKKMINTLIEEYKEKSRPFTVEISGQAHLTRFYENLGFTRVGESYFDAKIEHYLFIQEII